ncbi:MAG: lysophospholipid acyltransferase family protein [Treponemataceae bacterium]
MIFIATTIVFSGLIFWGIVNIIAYGISKKLSLHVSNLMVIHCPKIIFSTLDLIVGFKTFLYKDHKNELPEQFLILSNHQSVLDIPLYMKFIPQKKLRFVAKAELGRYVITVSEMLRVQQHALIKRTGSPSLAMKTLDVFAENTKKNNYCPVLFPEGSRSRDGKLNSFKPAGFRRLMEKNPLPVVVCVLDGGFKIASLIGIVRNLCKGEYRVKILKVFPPPQTKAEQIAILDEAKTLMEEQLALWRK